jgi:NADPH:quinone reductase
MSKTQNSGDDIAGIIAAVGESVYEFKQGDRVGAFHEMITPHGSFAEYAIAHDYTTFHLPNNVSFEEGATIPLAAMTSAIGLFCDLGIPTPWEDRKLENTPILIYGASSACGAFAAQLARLAGLGPIIGVAGRAQEYAKTLCDVVVDYRSGEDAAVKEITDALKKAGKETGKVNYVFDAISESGSHEIIARVVERGAKISHLLPKERFAKSGSDFKYPEGVKDITTSVGTAHKNRKDFAFLMFRYIARAMSDGRFKAQPVEVIPGGLAGVEQGLKMLADGKASGVKYVFRVSETQGAGEKL